MREKIEPHARLVTSLAETMTENMWASDILVRCQQMRDAISEIERVARGRAGGER